jgi:uncharacterized protein YegJ (DUF2314 family)
MDSSTAVSTNNNADGSAKAKTAQPRVRTIVKTIVPEYFTKLPPSEARQHLVKRCQAYPELVTHLMKFPKDEVDSNNDEHFWCIRPVKGENGVRISILRNNDPEDVDDNDDDDDAADDEALDSSCISLDDD